MKYHPDLSIKTSLRNLDYQNGVLNLPLVLLWNLPNYLDWVFAAEQSEESNHDIVEEER